MKTDVSPCSLLLGDISRGGTSATQRQKFHTDDVNPCLHNKSGSHGVPNANLIKFTFLLVDFGEVLCSSANELQQNSNASSREEYILQLLTVLLQIHRLHLSFLAFCLLSVFRKQQLKQCNYSVVQSALMTGFQAERPHRRTARRNVCFRRLMKSSLFNIFQWAIKIRGDTRKAQVIPQLVELLRIDYDPTIRAAAIALRNLCVDPENKKAVGKKEFLIAGYLNFKSNQCMKMVWTIFVQKSLHVSFHYSFRFRNGLLILFLVLQNI